MIISLSLDFIMSQNSSLSGSITILRIFRISVNYDFPNLAIYPNKEQRATQCFYIPISGHTV